MLKKSLRTPEDLLNAGWISPEMLPEIQAVSEEFSIALTPAVQASLTQPKDPVARQYLPDARELIRQTYERNDPVGDDAHSPVKGLVHRYPDRCLIKISNVCPVYCRFCFRKTMIGPGSKALSSEDRRKAIAYIQSHPEIWEVILTGGDPFILNPKILASTIQQLSEISQVKIIRIHTRVPISDPERISENLLNALKTEKMLIIAIHANHPQEFSDAAQASIRKLRLQGIPLVSQSVLLKDINDNAEILAELMRKFLENGIKPYYLHHLDPAPGTSHFAVSIQKGQELMKELRGRVSGLCQPTYVMDIPGGFGKSPINPSYLSEDLKEITDFRGGCHLLHS